MHVDLHMHTTISDGVLTPTQLVDLVASNGVHVMALTDHDTTNGLQEAFAAAQKYPQLTLIPGIELSCDIPGNEVHVLGYFLDDSDVAFQEKLTSFRLQRLDRGQMMVNKLRALGMDITWERVLEIASGGDNSVGRPHVAQALRTSPIKRFPSLHSALCLNDQVLVCVFGFRSTIPPPATPGR